MKFLNKYESEFVFIFKVILLVKIQKAIYMLSR